MSAAARVSACACLAALARVRARAVVLTLAASQLLLAACAERVVAPMVPPETPAASAIQGMTLRDIVERVAPSLADARLATALTEVIVQLRTAMEAGQLPEAARRLASARKLVHAARAAGDGAMDADLTVIELALDDTGGTLRAASMTDASRVRY